MVGAAGELGEEFAHVECSNSRIVLDFVLVLDNGVDYRMDQLKLMVARSSWSTLFNRPPSLACKREIANTAAHSPNLVIFNLNPATSNTARHMGQGCDFSQEDIFKF